MFIYPLSRIYNTSLVSAYFGLDKRECEWLEHLFIHFNNNIYKQNVRVYNGS
jgi:hypothetical protein